MNGAFGHPLRRLWALAGDGVFLNHGSYGAPPLSVLAEQQRLREVMERHPDAFMDRVKPDRAERALRTVAAGLANILATKGDRIALVENATTGIQAVLDSVELDSGDEILTTDQQYNAVRLAIERRCAQAGAAPRVVPIPLPTTPGEFTQRVLDATGPHTRLAILDHIASSSALMMPLEMLVPELRRRGIRVLVDGAHAIGQLPLNLPSLGADWYVSNVHKWLYAPRGSALLWAAGTVAPLTRPVLTSHYIGMGFPHAFDYVGTRDYTAWLAIPAALAFFASLGPEQLWQHEARLVDAGTDALLASGALPAGPRQMCAAMRAFILPQRREPCADDASGVMRTLWERERIQIRCALASGRLLLRFCSQAYVEASDLEQLGAALQRHGWPGRA